VNQNSLAVGVDVGGSSIKSAVVDLSSGDFTVARRSVPTPAHGPVAAMLESIATVVSEFDPGLSVGIAFPSVIRAGIVETAANINKDWIGQPLTALAQKRLARQVIAINDADAAGLAEVKCGAARDVTGLVLVLTLGTGIGSALFLDGHLIGNSELGHLQVDGQEAELRAAGRVRTENNLSWDQWSAGLSRVLQEYQALLWPELIVLCGGITEDAPQFLDKLVCRAPLRIGKLRADAGIVGAALATAATGPR
jgi:polyphosphate glucokinase